jgi:hypothetical protein
VRRAEDNSPIAEVAKKHGVDSCVWGGAVATLREARTHDVEWTPSHRNGEFDEPGSIEQALSVATCRVTGGGAPSPDRCSSPTVSRDTKMIFTTVPPDVQGTTFEWIVNTNSAGVTKGAKCKDVNSNVCEVFVVPECRGAASKEVTIMVKIRRPNVPVEESKVIATAPNFPCIIIPAPDPICVEPPRAIPTLAIFTSGRVLATSVAADLGETRTITCISTENAAESGLPGVIRAYVPTA